MPHPSTHTPSRRTVERIREILIGRQMQRVEKRLERLETQLQPMPVESGERRTPSEDELVRLRDEIDAERLRQLDETRRLAQQIQSVARGRHDAFVDVRRSLEQDLGQWFQQWQDGLQRHLREREEWLVGELRTELDRIRAWIRDELARRPASPADLDQLHDSFEDLAKLTRSIAERLQGAPSGERQP